jgi:Bacterial Ig domain/PKD domain
VTLTVEAQNQAPACEPVSETTLVETAVEVELSCSDPDGDDLTLEIVDGPDHGTLGDVAAGTVTHTPEDDYFGADSFTYRASDGDLQSTPATVTLDVQAKPEVTLGSDRTSARVGETITFRATASDPDGQVEEYRFSADGSVVKTGASWLLAHSFDTPGTHTVQVRVTDDDGRTATASKTVTITAPPTAGGGGTPPPAGGGGPVGGGPAADVAPPAAALKAAKQKLKAVLAKGLALTASCSEPCTLKLQLVVDKKTAKKLKLGKRATVVGTLTRTISGTAKLKVKLTGKAKKRLKKARSVKLTVTAVATDAAGNAATKTAKVTLKR